MSYIRRHSGIVLGSAGITTLRGCVLASKQSANLAQFAPSADAPGVVLTSDGEARVLDGLRAGIDELFRDDRRAHYIGPPVIARKTSELAGYTGSFPQLLGSVYSAPDGGSPAASDLVLTSAACHHLYPLFLARGDLAGDCLSVEAACFREEAATEPGRLRSFRMYEVVLTGTAVRTRLWRDEALTRANAWLGRLGLDTQVVRANDPFFGQAGRHLAAMQVGQELKWEITAPVDTDIVHAIASANWHRDHFGTAFDLPLADGSPANSACMAFGLDRVALALYHRYGRDLVAWPDNVGAALNLDTAVLTETP